MTTSMLTAELSNLYCSGSLEATRNMTASLFLQEDAMGVAASTL
jgi:hypothetical protein